jgi:hypothetical protein
VIRLAPSPPEEKDAQRVNLGKQWVAKENHSYPYTHASPHVLGPRQATVWTRQLDTHVGESVPAGLPAAGDGVVHHVIGHQEERLPANGT